MSFFKFNKNKEKSIVKLEGCLDPSKRVNLCGHGNHADACVLCDREQREKGKTNRSQFFSLDSDSMKETIKLD